jgi:hypothetical protein
VGPSSAIELMKMRKPIGVVRQRAAEGPPLVGHHRLDHRYRHGLIELFDRPGDQGAVRPGTGERNIEVITPRLSRITTGSVGGDPVAKSRDGANELALGRCGVIPAFAPMTIFEITAHSCTFQ